MTNDGPDREVDPNGRELFFGCEVAESDAQSGSDLAASLTAALFGSIDEASKDSGPENAE